MSNENRGQPKRIRVMLTLWELERIIEAMEYQPQDSNDKTVMLTLWAARDRLKEKTNGNL